MAEYKPPCHFGPCPERGDVGDSGQRICDAIAKCIIGAGGVGVLETHICPTNALFTLGPEQENPLMKEVRDNLGIIGYFEEDVDFLD